MKMKQRKIDPWRLATGLLYLVFFIGVYFLCRQIAYTDGDDAYFSTMAHSMGFFAYLKMRYLSWEGRMGSEALTYLCFYLGKEFWNVANAGVFTLLPYLLLLLIRKMSAPLSAKKEFFRHLGVFMALGLFGVEVIGYGCLWVTGSIFYLWMMVTGLVAAIPFVRLVFPGKKKKPDKENSLFLGENFKNRTAALKKRAIRGAFLLCALVTAMGQEQIGAVVFTFGVLAVIYYVYRVRRVPVWETAELLLMLAGLMFSLLSPGTAERSVSEIAAFMPQFATMSIGNHLFITYQWVLSSLAIESRALLLMLWALATLLQISKRPDLSEAEQKKQGRPVESLLFFVLGLLPYFGLTAYTDLGMGITDVTQCVTNVATPGSLSKANWSAMVIWTVAILYTLLLLWQTGKNLVERVLYQLLFLAALASEAILYFSPSMYASGARLYLTAQLLLWLLIGKLLGELLSGKQFSPVWKTVAFLVLTLLIALNVSNQWSVVAAYFVG